MCPRQEYTLESITRPENEGIRLEIDELEGRLEQQLAMVPLDEEEVVCPYYFCRVRCDLKCMTF